MKRRIRIAAWALVATLAISACKKNDNNPTVPTDTGVHAPNLPATPYNYANVTLPAHLQGPRINNEDNTPADNPITDAGATLGRVLFYDNNLSINNKVACASCHLQANGFSDKLTLSKGFDGGNTGRNSMGLINARYYPNGKFFWDERAATAEAQALMPIQDHVEMGMTLDSLEKRLSAVSYYPALFQNAFGDKTVTADKISKALAQFVRSIVSYNSNTMDWKSIGWLFG